MPTEPSPWPTTDDPNMQLVFDTLREHPEGLTYEALEDAHEDLYYAMIDRLVDEGFLVRTTRAAPEPEVDYPSFAASNQRLYVLGSSARVDHIRELRDALNTARSAWSDAQYAEDRAKCLHRKAQAKTCAAYVALQDAEQALEDARSGSDV